VGLAVVEVMSEVSRAEVEIAMIIGDYD
jgi:hypothetical protein